MNQLKKVFFAVVAVVAFGFATQSAHAKLTCQTASTPTLVRSEGTIEVMGKVDMNCTSDGAGIVTASMTVSILPPTATVAPTSSGNTTCGAGGNNTSTFPLPSITTNAGGADPSGFPAAPTCSVSGNTATFNFTPADVNQIISIQGIRANMAASGLVGGSPVTANLTVSPTVTNQISITNPTLTVAFAYLSTFTLNNLSIASCAPGVVTPAGAPATFAGNPDFSVGAVNSIKAVLTEGFPTAWQVGVAEDGGPGLSFGQGTRFRIQLTGIPSGFNVYAPEIVSGASLANTGSVAPTGSPVTITRVTGAALAADGSGGAVIAAPVADQYDRITVSSGTATIVYQVTVNEESAALVPALNTVAFNIALTGIATTGTGTVNGSIGYAPIGPPTTNASRPQFAAPASAARVSVNICATYLLFPWVANTGDGNYDTGFAISNTTADPTVIGTAAQAGSVTMYFFRSDGTNNPSPVTLSSSLPAGQTTTYVLSSLGSAFTGYTIAVCNFQLGHGFAFINNPRPGTGGAFSQGYLALSVTNPRLGVGQILQLGAGALESAVK
jgi:hypothetical protein